MEHSRHWVSLPGNPVASASAILKVVDAAEPPLRVFFGEAPLGIMKADYADRMATWEKWNPVSIEAQGESSILLESVSSSFF